MSDELVPTPLFEQDLLRFQTPDGSVYDGELLELDIVSGPKDPTPKLRVTNSKGTWMILRSAVLGVLCPRCKNELMVAYRVTYPRTVRIPDELYRYGLPARYETVEVSDIFRIGENCQYMRKAT